LYGLSPKKLVSVAELKRADDGSELTDSFFKEAMKKRGPSKTEKVMGGMLKFYYYFFLKEFSREPNDLYDFFDGINFINLYYSEVKGM
jgi:hypothetical protein